MQESLSFPTTYDLVGDAVGGPVGGIVASPFFSSHKPHASGHDSLIGFPSHTMLQRFSLDAGFFFTFATHLHFLEPLYLNKGSSTQVPLSMSFSKEDTVGDAVVGDTLTIIRSPSHNNQPYAVYAVYYHNYSVEVSQ